jgi:hypothetical protein
LHDTNERAKPGIKDTVELIEHHKATTRSAFHTNCEEGFKEQVQAFHGDGGYFRGRVYVVMSKMKDPVREFCLFASFNIN